MPSRWTKWFKDGEPVDLPDGEWMANDRFIYSTDEDGKLAVQMETRYRPMEESDGS